MPLYEYYCSDCRGKFELLISYAASESDIVCTKCHGSKVRKLFSVFARPSRGGAADDFGEYGGYDEGGDDFGEKMSGGGCSCGGACSCAD